jgi:CBS domain-containing protein
MRAPDFMTRPVITVLEESTLKDAARLLLRHRVSAAPVVDSGGRLVGLVNELDLLLGGVPADPVAHVAPLAEALTAPVHFVREVMTTDVVGLPEDADAAAFAELMRMTGFKSIPVLRGEHVVGIVSRRDLLRAVARDDADIRDDVVQRIREYDGDIAVDVLVDGGVVTLRPTGGETAQLGAAMILARGVPGAVRVRLEPTPATS